MESFPDPPESKLIWDFSASIMEDTIMAEYSLRGSNQISRQIINTREEIIRESLKKLGWMPPEEATKLENEVKKLRNVVDFYKNRIILSHELS